MRGPDGNYKGTDSLGLLSKSQESFCQENLLSPFSGDQSPGFVFRNTMNQVEFVMDSFLSDLLSPSRICYFHLTSPDFQLVRLSPGVEATLPSSQMVREAT